MNKKRAIAFVLSTFFGSFGIHRLYVGKTGSGVAMLLIGLTFVGLIVTSIWNLVDWIMLITGDFTDGEGNKMDW